MADEQDSAQAVRDPRPAVVLRAPAQADARTFCVMGSAAGGTSMVAGVLRLLGVHMGERLDPANNEDMDFVAARAALHSRLPLGPLMPLFLRRFKRLVRARDARHAVWGWKDPLSFVCLRALAPHLRNLHLLVVFRDPVAVAERESLRTGVPHAEGLRTAFERYERILDTVERLRRPTLLISYERALQRPELCVAQIAEFVGLPCDEARLREVATFIRPERGGGDLSGVTRDLDAVYASQQAE